MASGKPELLFFELTETTNCKTKPGSAVSRPQCRPKTQQLNRVRMVLVVVGGNVLLFKDSFETGEQKFSHVR